uniref:Uncharacterized protein n=1 Tax=Arundo donax TaxID=35708 RepID=A0A0A9DJM9_ARUDO
MQRIAGAQTEAFQNLPSSQQNPPRLAALTARSRPRDSTCQSLRKRTPNFGYQNGARRLRRCRPSGQAWSCPTHRGR